MPGNKVEHNVCILPEEYKASRNIETKTLIRGIYDFSVYEAPLQLSGTFTLPKELTAEQLNRIKAGHARLLFSVSDFRSFTDNPVLTYEGATIELSSEGYKLGGDNAISALVPIQTILNGGRINFSLSVPLKGSNDLSIVPVGRTTTVSLSSDCPTPSFGGDYLPANRNVTPQGFTADWKVLGLNRDFPQILSSSAALGNSAGIEVSLRVPVEQYQQTTRSIKYAYLVILLTFAIVFLVENRRQTPIHPVQYALVGLALVLFYTLLLSFSEHIAFGLSYLIASLMTISLITLFMRALLRQWGGALAVGGLLVLLYLFIYVLLQLESYALLVGSLGIFAILAAAMYASRKINWYQAG
jgi:inner membrane protein